jgi:hypothetical protein
MSAAIRWAAALGLWAATALATDTAFWKPYAAADAPLALLHFDGTSAGEATGQIARAESVGAVRLDPAGKFGGALRLDGRGAVRLMTREPLDDGVISVEAWVRLERYPERDAVIVSIPWVKEQSGGLTLRVDAQGALTLETRTLQRGETNGVPSAPGAVPTNVWVHVAGICAGFAMLYGNGRQVARSQDAYYAPKFQGSRQPAPILVGNSEAGDQGLTGWVDEVRVHRRVCKLWAPEDTAWTGGLRDRPLAQGPPHFLAGRTPLLHLPLDGDLQPASNSVAGLRVRVKQAAFRPGIRGQSCFGLFDVSAPRLLDREEGAIAFWMQPRGYNNLSDGNVMFVSGGSFSLYFFNHSSTPKAMTVIVGQPNDTRVFLEDDGPDATEFREGAWYHVAIAWKHRTVTLYLNGRQAGEVAGVDLLAPVTQLSFAPYGAPVADFDEVYLYRQALTATEAANSYWRYRDPAKLVEARGEAVRFRAQYFPSPSRVYYRLLLEGAPAEIAGLQFVLRQDGRAQSVFEAAVPLAAGEQTLEVPKLAAGTYALSLRVTDRQGRPSEAEPLRFERQVFAWEGNTRGTTDEVYPPYEPVTVRGAEAAVVGRRYAARVPARSADPAQRHPASTKAS